MGLGLLMCCCQEELEKTRSNAAGALGNLVRNADLLAPALTELGAVKALMAASDPADGMDSSSKVALYSLGSLPLPTLLLCDCDLNLLLSCNPYAFRRAPSPSPLCQLALHARRSCRNLRIDQGCTLRLLL
jgi:hypothetical protein